MTPKKKPTYIMAGAAIVIDYHLTKVENESVLLIALKIFICLFWCQCGETRARGIQGLVQKAERWFWTQWTERTKSSCRRSANFEFRCSVVKLVKKTCENCYLLVSPSFRAAETSCSGYLTKATCVIFIHLHILKHRLRDKTGWVIGC